MSEPLKVKVTTVGDSVGVILPDEVVARLKIGDGDTVVLTETPSGLRSHRTTLSSKR